MTHLPYKIGEERVDDEVQEQQDVQPTIVVHEHLNQCYSSNSLPLVQVASRVGWA